MGRDEMKRTHIFMYRIDAVCHKRTSFNKAKTWILSLGHRVHQLNIGQCLGRVVALPFACRHSYVSCFTLHSPCD